MRRQLDFWGQNPLPEIHLMMPETALLSGCDREQIDLLSERDRMPGVTVSYLPLGDQPRPLLKGPFTVILFDGGGPDVVYSESISGARYEDRKEAVKAHLNTFTSQSEQAQTIEEFRYDE